MSSGTVPIDSEWAQAAIELKRHGKESAEIAIAVGKSAATVRKVLKAARERGLLPDGPVAETNGNGHAPGPEFGFGLPGAPDQIPGQTTVDDYVAPPELHEHTGPGYDKPAFEAEAGEAVGPMPPREMDEGETVFVEEIRVDGTTQLGLFNAGGKAPDSASLRLSGGRILLLDGQAFRKGDTIRFSGTAVVREVGQRDKPDPKTGIVVSAEQKHVAQITDLRVE